MIIIAFYSSTFLFGGMQAVQMIRFSCIFCFLLCLSSLLYAQPATSSLSSHSDKAKKLYEESTLLLSARKWDQAVAALQKALEKDPDFAEAHYRLARTYQIMGADEDKSIYHFEKTIGLMPDAPVFMDAHLMVGQHYLYQGNYEKAKPFLVKYLSLKPPKTSQVDIAKKLIATCDFAVEAIKKPLPFKSYPLSKVVNKFALQYFPVLTVDQQTLIFTARNLSQLDRDENLYISTWKDNAWTSPEAISKAINSAGDEGTCSISADGRTLVFTSCEGRKNFGRCDLFVSYKIGDDWTEPINLGPEINSYSWESQPSLSADGRTLYFVSDRRGGFGKKDIWFSKLESDKHWGAPVNLGPTINTNDEDISPFIHANGTTLFFASKGHLGLGAHDLFISENKKGSWTTPENLGYPINTHEDQVSLFVTADGKKGYYSLEEHRGQQYLSAVLHEFSIPEALAIKYNKSDYLKGTVYDARTKQRIGAKIELFNIGTNYLEAVVESDRKTGEYVSVLTEGAEYALYINKDGYLFKSLSFDFSKKQEHKSLTLDIYLEPIQQGAKEILNNIFFETGKYALELKSQTELDKIHSFLKEHPNLTLEVSGHTDDVGKDADNMELSLKRAKSLHDYLLKVGIPKNRIRFQGYGETRPVVPNDSEPNRQLNRRIELKVL